MAFRTLAGHVGRGAAAVGSATAGAVMVSPNQAFARAPPSPATTLRPLEAQESYELQSSKIIADDWLLPILEKDDVLFSSEDLAEAAASLRQVTINTPGHPLSIQDDASSDGSDGGHVNDVIELAEQTVLQQPQLNSTVNITPENINLLLDVATELLKKPRVQYELLGVIASHPQLRHHVLESAGMESGFHPALPLAAQPLLLEVPPTTENNKEGHEDGEDMGVWGGVLAHIGEAFMTVGKRLNMAMDRVGSWLQSVLKGKEAAQPDAVGEPSHCEGSEGAEGDNGTGLNGLMKATMLVAVVIACLVIARRPSVAVRAARFVATKGSAV